MILAGVEQVDDFARFWIDAGKIGALQEIAAVACECQSLRIIEVFVVRRVLLRYYMLNVKRDKGRGRLWQMAVLTAITSPLANAFFRLRIHVKSFDEPRIA